MISFLRGKIVDLRPDTLLIDVRDIGYEVKIPYSTFEKLPEPGQETLIQTVLQIRETEHSLYGFISRAEKDLFLLLINHVSGIGPKLALAVLNGSSPESFQVAVATRDVASLSKTKGLGKKTAERIIVELKDKMDIPDQWQPVSETNASPELRRRQDAVLALLALGYKQPEALKALDLVGEIDETGDFVREALKHLNK
ncbi:MAG: Holliday junction branch migration protein RuvA [Verrucomicrobiota bacterium]